MAVLISRASGNFSAAGTWGVVDPTSLLDSEAVPANLTAAWSQGASFTPGAIVIDGIAVKASNRVGSVGTWTVQLYNVTDASIVAGTTVTINISDLDANTYLGWVMFSFSAITLVAGKAYAVRTTTSQSSIMICYRDATVGNFSRMLRTTTTKAPAATDVMHVLGERTGQATGNDISVTMDLETNTDFGPGTDGNIALTVGCRGTLSYGYASGKNYYLKLSGDMKVYRDGTFNIGTIANPIPRDSTAVLEFDPVADGGMGLIVYGACNMQGLSRSAGKNIVSCKLSANALANATSLTVDTDTGWLDNDQIGVGTTSTVYTENELGALNGNAGAGSINVDGFAGTGGGLKYAHTGVSPAQGEVINITRNIKIRSVSYSAVTYIYLTAMSVVDFDWVEIYYLCKDTLGQRGLQIVTAGGSCNITYCSLHDCKLYGMPITGYGIYVTYCVFWAASDPALSGYVVGITTMTGPNWEFSNNVIMGGRMGIYTSGTVGAVNTKGVINNVRVYGTFSNGFYLSTTYGHTIENCILVGNGNGISILGWDGGVLNNVAVYRQSYGIYFRSGCPAVTINGAVLFGNSNNILSGTYPVIADFYTCVVAGDSAYPSLYGLCADGAGGTFRFFNCTFGVSAGIFTGHGSADIRHTNANGSAKIYLYNCVLGSSSAEVTNSNINKEWGIYSTRHDQTNGLYKTWTRGGLIERDTSVFHTASPAQKLTPASTTYKLESGIRAIPVDNGGTPTITVWVRKSKASTGDSANYTGNQPRLIIKRNDAVGITADTVIDTMVEAIGTWEKLSGVCPAVTDDGIIEVVVDCDGATGFVSVDDWGVS